MNIDLEDEHLIALAKAYLDSSSPANRCVVDCIEECGEDLKIHYSWGRGSGEEVIHPVNLLAWGWNNPKT